jgi:hypothetical protein
MPTLKPIKTSDIPASLNGYPVIGWTISADRERALVIVQRPQAFLPFVAAQWWPELGDAWQWGNYYDTRDEAEAYRANWIKTAHGISYASGSFADEGNPRIKTEGRIGGFQ